MLDKIKTDKKESIRFDNHYVDHLPGDSELKNFRRQVPGACYSRVNPTPVRSPKLVSYAEEVADMLDLSSSFCRSEDFVQLFSGNTVFNGMVPYAMCYGGHQFGNWAGQLGDGRAINLGELTNKQSESFTLQLKGAGPTPYSRQADGLAVLRSSIREFLCSEAMHHLGVATTRALSIVTTGEDVERDMFYDGHPRDEPGAVVCRVSPSFIRFGNFEIHAARQETDLLQKLADYTIKNYFPELGPPSKETYIRWFESVCEKTADMIVDWMRVGFVHGVMNTDNMSILGLTIDYGPYGWLEGYDPSWTPNTTDAGTRRYCFGNQPGIAQWNLAQLANAIFPLIKEAPPLQEAVNRFGERYKDKSSDMMAEKLGLETGSSDTIKNIIEPLPDILRSVETDYTIFFRRLADIELGLWKGNGSNLEEMKSPIQMAYYNPDDLTDAYRSKFDQWFVRYLDRVKEEGHDPVKRKQSMNQVNPKYVLRNYMAQLAIDKAETGDFSKVGEMLDLVRKPYDEQPDQEEYFARRPEWARNKPGCSMLSCSS